MPMARCEADGGVLRLHRADGDVDVEPLLDRCVIFWSDHRTPHEVHPAAVAAVSKQGKKGGSKQGREEATGRSIVRYVERSTARLDDAHTYLTLTFSPTY